MAWLKKPDREHKMQRTAKHYFFTIKQLIKNNNIYSYLVGMYVFVWFTQIGKRIPFFDTIRLEFLLGALLVILSCVALSKKQKINRTSGMAPIVVILIFYYGIFAFATYDPVMSWHTYYNKVIKYALLAFFIYAIIDNIHKLAFLLLCYFLAALKSGQEGLLGWLTGNMVWESQGIPRLHGSIDMYGHPNSFSGFAVCLLPFIYNFYPLANKYLKFGLIFLGICAAIIILFTGSRTGYIATVAFILYVLLTTMRKSFLKFLFVMLPVILISINFLPDEYKGRFESIFTQEDKEGGSTNARKQILFDAVDVFLEHPMGVGLAAFPKVRGEMFGRTQDTHNLYMQVLTNTGFIGLGLFLTFVITMIRCNQRILRSLEHNTTFEARFLSALAASVIGYLYARLFLGLFGMDMYEIYWWLALGLTTASFYLANKLFSNPPPGGRSSY